MIYLGADSECIMGKVPFGVRGAWVGADPTIPRSPAVASSGIHPFQACPLLGSSLMDGFQREGFYDGFVGGDVLQC